ncbi:alpha/beta fold hydrolase [Chitinophaga sp. 22620]|uniref:alpha/beta fold hydrolase n=1 Tax=Chitinophaga sp. 22620 TaxID=3453952 RepID=UPI003F850098
MFEAFTHKKITVADCHIDLVMAGEGPPLLLLHGFPETKAAWHQIAPQLAASYTVILPDLPGYGDSTGPVPNADNSNYTKRSMGNILVQLMRQLGFSTFALAGHDRGGRVAYRMALDHPDEISRLAVLNIIPTLEMMDRFTYDMAVKMGNWIFLAQPAPLPERLLQENAEFYLDYVLDDWSVTPGLISPEARAAYLRCFKKKEVIAAMCAEYRASVLDAAYDQEDRANHRRIRCPVLALWSEKDFSGPEGPLPVWKNWADQLSGAALPGGHFLMEECPDGVLEQFLRFFKV